MKSPNRDLLVLLKDESMSEQAIEQEVEKLNAMLYHVESVDNISKSLEMIDLNKYKIIRKSSLIAQTVRQKVMKPFIFLCNMN